MRSFGEIIEKTILCLVVLRWTLIDPRRSQRLLGQVCHENASKLAKVTDGSG